MKAFMLTTCSLLFATHTERRHRYLFVDDLVMIYRLLRQPRRRLVSLFTVILCAMSAVMGSYVYSACQKASTDYTTLISDIVLAQQATPQLREALEEGSRLPG